MVVAADFVACGHKVKGNAVCGRARARPRPARSCRDHQDSVVGGESGIGPLRGIGAELVSRMAFGGRVRLASNVPVTRVASKSRRASPAERKSQCERSYDDYAKDARCHLAVYSTLPKPGHLGAPTLLPG